MKRLSVLVCVVACLLGCKERKVAPTFDDSPKVTAEQAGSTVLVRVLRNGQPQKDCTGALIRSDEFPETAAVQGINRCVLTLLRGWKEAQLRAPEIRFFVFRNQADSHGEIRALSHPARLLQFDENSGVAALNFMEEFDSKKDVGYPLERTGAGAAPLSAMMSRISPNPNSAVGPGGRYDQTFSVAMGDFASLDGQRGRLRFAATPTQRDEAPLCISREGKLVGFFADDKAGEATLIRVGDFRLNVVLPMLKPAGIAFGKQLGNRIPFVIHTEQTSGQPVKWVFVRITDFSAGKTDVAAADTNANPAMDINQMPRLDPQPDGAPGWRGELDAPEQAGQQIAYRIQIGWPVSEDESAPPLFAPPFVVRLADANGVVTARVEGIQNINDAKAAGQKDTKRFGLESSVLDIRDIAGGREILMQFESAPYWKRFSFARNDWEPLPLVNLSTAEITGNLDAIFVLDRGASEVRKYAREDLRLLASARLPSGRIYVTIVAGSASAHAPVHVFLSNEIISLDPETLQRRVLYGRDQVMRAEPGFDRSRLHGLQITGDGLSIKLMGPTTGVGPSTYTNDATGMDREFFGQADVSGGDFGRGVSDAFGLAGRGTLTSCATDDGTVRISELAGYAPIYQSTLVPSSPVYFATLTEDDRAIPPLPVRLSCRPYFGTGTFEVIETPELAAKAAPRQTLQVRSFAFDPYTMRLGTVSADRKSWTVRRVNADPQSNQPVLLNWPDTSLVRGGEFRFTPVILNGKEFSAELVGNKTATPLKIEAGTVSFRIAQDELASLMLLTLKIPKKEGGEIAASIPIHVFGPKLPVAASLAMVARDIHSLGTSFKMLGGNNEDWRVLQSRIHSFADPVKEIAGLVAGHLILICEENRVDFLSLETGKIATSFPTNGTAVYFAGAEALFEYDPATRSLSRISVPDGRRQKVIALPGKSGLGAIALGDDSNSPLTLIFGDPAAQISEHRDDAALGTPGADPSIIVLDSRSLQPGEWAQPKPVVKNGAPAPRDFRNSTSALPERPARLPSARNGLFVSLPQGFIALGKDVSVFVRYPGEQPGVSWNLDPSRPVRGSLSGMIVSDAGRHVFVGGVPRAYPDRETTALEVSPCGRYRLLRESVTDGNEWPIDVRIIESNKLLFRFGRLTLAQHLFANTGHSRRDSPLSLVAPTGPMVILSGDGKNLQVVDCDIPKLAQQLVPSEFHITSQASPAVMEGGSLDYQIQTNNPTAVTGYKLRVETEGTTLSSGGLLHFNAPQHVTAPRKVIFSIEIAGKDGNTVLHEFPVFVVPFPRNAPAPKPPVPNRIPI